MRNDTAEDIDTVPATLQKNPSLPTALTDANGTGFARLETKKQALQSGFPAYGDTLDYYARKRTTLNLQNYKKYSSVIYCWQVLRR